MSKLIKTRSDLLNFCLETEYVNLVFGEELQKVPVPPEEKDAKSLRILAMDGR